MITPFAKPLELAANFRQIQI